MREAVNIKVEYYLDANGKNPFKDWYLKLDRVAADKVDDAIAKRERGITGHSKYIRDGVHELKLAGLRIYYAIDGDKLIILLGGGRKDKRQDSDINDAIGRLKSHRDRKRTSRKQGMN